MNILHFWRQFTALALAAIITGCSDEKSHHAETTDAHVHVDAHADEAAAEESVTFKEGGGLHFTPEVRQALALKLTKVEMQPLAGRRVFSAQVFSDGTAARALSVVSPEQANGLTSKMRGQVGRGVRKTDTAGVELIAISRTAEKASGLAELLFALPAAEPAFAVGEDVVIELIIPAGEPVPFVPRAALLDTASGTFVYVVREENYLRVPVKIGETSEDRIGISSGLQAGDTVVVSPVNVLWLTELRLIKGGGHSH